MRPSPHTCGLLALLLGLLPATMARASGPADGPPPPPVAVRPAISGEARSAAAAAAPPAPRRAPDLRAPRAGQAALAVVAALGVVGMGIGGKAIADDGRPTCAPGAPGVMCPEVADSRGAGIGLAVAGAVLTAASAMGIVLLEFEVVAPRQAVSATRVTLIPLIGNSWGLSIAGMLGAAP